ncbi:MAG: hypothetical protein WAK12_08775 [Acidimicrobiales bacterium]
MAGQKRMMAIVIAVVALALTVTGVVIAATNSNASGPAKDPLALNGYPPKTADLLVTVSTGSGVTLNANLDVNFTTNQAQAVANFPLVITTASVNLCFAEGDVYERSADVSSGPWYWAKLKLPNLFGVSLEMTKPDIDLITGFQKTVTKSGYSTTYQFHRTDVALSHLLGKAKANSALGSIRWTITVGSQGELSQSTLVEQTKRSTIDLSVTVLSYNQPVHVSVPSSSNLEPLSRSAFYKLLSSVNFSSLLIPSGLTSFSKASLS